MVAWRQQFSKVCDSKKCSKARSAILYYKKYSSKIFFTRSVVKKLNVWTHLRFHFVLVWKPILLSVPKKYQLFSPHERLSFFYGFAQLHELADACGSFQHTFSKIMYSEDFYHFSFCWVNFDNISLYKHIHSYCL